MPSVTPNEHRALFGALTDQREHIFEALDGLDVDDLRRQMLPSGWTCLGLVNHLSIDVERFWFQAVIAGDHSAVEDGFASTSNAWDVGIEVSAESVLHGYRHNIERADAIITTRSLDAEPAWWPEILFGPWRLDSVREVVLTRSHRDRRPRRSPRRSARADRRQTATRPHRLTRQASAEAGHHAREPSNIEP